ncbi:uncharacterized protein LOC123893082 [Trifolium pratense]|uniref:uncharacterized protein LOC123893082 n=1 Tax=Trifolium pratense TaxID=57577 RepID=UPI001E6909DD|nr:uncharacterized protein LOC123893082 [Trifolium pratense]
MANHIDMISTINDVPRNWRLIVRVVRLWGVPEFNTPNQFRSLELVLMDSEGTTIHCSVKKTLIYLFQKQLSEGVVYTLTTFDVVRSTANTVLQVMFISWMQLIILNSQDLIALFFQR